MNYNVIYYKTQTGNRKMGRYVFVMEKGVRIPFAIVGGSWKRCNVSK